MNKTLDRIKSGNYEVVDNQGVSVTAHFAQCLEKEFADLEAKLAEIEEENKKLVKALNGEVFINYKLPMENAQLKQQLAKKEKEIDGIKKQSLENIALLYENATLIENPNDCNMMLSCLNRIKAGTPYIMQEVDVKLEKYDFAVKQLEKVKDYFIEGYAVCKNFSDFYWNFTEQIDNQIEELKKEIK